MMNCQDWEERVALHVGGDLPAAEAADVERHLAECVGCQVFWSGMKESLELLHGAHAEEVAAGYVTAVHARVMAELEAGRRAWRRRGWVVGLAAAVVAMVVVLTSWPVRRLEMPAVRVAAVIPPAQAAASQGLRPRQARGLPHKRQMVRQAQVGKMPQQPLLVRMVTDDPNVVIYWIAD